MSRRAASLRLLIPLCALSAVLVFGLWDRPVSPDTPTEQVANESSQDPAHKTWDPSSESSATGAGPEPTQATIREAIEPPEEVRLALDVRGFVDPPDRVEVGPHILTLQLTDRRTGEPATGTIELWRISAPANSNWTVGDQRLERTEIEDGRVRFDRLANGRYRVFLWDVERGSEDPAAVEIAGASLDTQLFVDMPWKADAKIDVVRSDGEAPSNVEISQRPVGGVMHTFHPSWVVRRERVDVGPVGVSGGFSGLSSRGRFRNFERTSGGFDLGEVSRSSRRRASSKELKIRSGTWSTQCRVSGEELQRSDIVFVLADRAVVLESIYLPSGAGVGDGDGFLMIGGEPGFGSRASVAERAVVQVTYRLSGYEPLEFEWRPSDGPPPPRILQRESR